jgi:hypothetical protein
MIHNILNGTVPNLDGVARIYDGKLPFYGTIENARKSLKHFNSVARRSPKIINALAVRNREMIKLKDELQKAGFIPEGIVNAETYFHEQVINRMNIDNSYLFKVHKRAGDKEFDIMNASKASPDEYSTNYVVSEYRMLSEAIGQLQINKLKNEIRDRYDIVKRLIIKQGTAENLTIPEGYVRVTATEHSGWGAAPRHANTILNALFNGFGFDKLGNKVPLADYTDSAKRKIRDQFKESENVWIIPVEMRDAMKQYREISNADAGVERILQGFVNGWRIWTLLNPIKAVAYNINNMIGDGGVALTHPKIYLEVKDAIRDLAGDVKSSGLKLPGNVQRWAKDLTQETKDELTFMHESEVIGAGFVINEISDIDEEMNMLMAGANGGGFSIKQFNWWQGTKDATNFRENIFRVASFRYFKKRILAGDKHVYGASNPKEIDDIVDVNLKAAKLSRELIGDYGRISHGGKWVRKNLVPFYSWLEINAPRYVRLMRNIPHENDSKLNMAWQGSLMGMKMAGLTLLVSMFNGMMFPDEEDELQGYQKRHMHLILGRHDDGTIRYIPISDAFRDALAWFGGDDAYYDITDVTSGKATVNEKLKETAFSPFKKVMGASAPFYKLFTDLQRGSTANMGGNVVPIRDNFEHIAKTFSADIVYRAAMGMPTKGVGEEYKAKLMMWSIDPGESAYYKVRDMVNTFNKNNDPYFKYTEGSGSGGSSEKSVALFYYKQSLKFADFESAGNYLKKYVSMGGTMEGIKTSYASSLPTAGLSKTSRNKFYSSLSDKDKVVLNTASKWYKNTYNKSPREYLNSKR